MSSPVKKLIADAPSWIELESVQLLEEAERITTLSRDTIERRYPQFIVNLSPRRRGMKLKHILEITNGR